MTLAPIAPGVWTNEASPRLIGGKRADGEIVFPMPVGDAAAALEPVALSRKGRLWSWTRQDFEPKSPYDGPQPFVPFLLGSVTALWLYPRVSSSDVPFGVFALFDARFRRI